MHENLKVLLLGFFGLSAWSVSAEPQSTVGNMAHVKTANATKQQRLAQVEQDVEQLLAKMTLPEKISLVHASGKFHINAIERLAIPEMWLSDGPHGVRHQIQRDSWNSAGWTDDYATYLPHLTSVAASWDVNIAKLHGQVLGSEARDRGKDFILGPGVNLARLPLYGRNFEYLGEDPFLAATLVVPQIHGIQEHDVAATVKHFALNTQELNRTGVNAQPDERTLREVYLPAFEAAVKAGGVLGMMGSYNQYFGTNANQSKHLVKDILKGEWGYQGVLLTDWNVDINTYDAAINGLDLEMGTEVASYDDYFFAKPLLQMITSGKIPESVLDDKVRRILRVQHTIGMMDKNRQLGERNSQAHQAAARKIAAESVVLLKNELGNGQRLLPLAKAKLKNILVMGPNAAKKHGNGGGSSEVKSPYEISPLAGLTAYLGDAVNITVMRAKSGELTPIASEYVASRHWTGTPAWHLAYYTDSLHQQLVSESWLADARFIAPSTEKMSHVVMTARIKPLATGMHSLKLSAVGDSRLRVDGEEVMAQNHGDDAVILHEMMLTSDQTYQFELSYDGKSSVTLGWDAPGNLFNTEQDYLAAAKKADAVIYFGGLSHGDDRESIDRISMTLPDAQDEVINKLLAVNDNTIVLLVAGSAVAMPWADKAKAIVWGWYGGMEAGHAFADVLFGAVNPSGKMPITLPAKLSDTAPIALNDYNESNALYKEGVFIGYRWFEQQNITPTFVFGHGLSYTEFAYSDLALSTTELRGEDSISVTLTVKNIGQVAGAEVVQLYLNDVASSVPRPIKELKGFEKVFLQPNESKQVRMVLTRRDLSFWQEKSQRWLAEPGQFTVLVGSSLTDIRLTRSFTYTRYP